MTKKPESARYAQIYMDSPIDTAIQAIRAHIAPQSPIFGQIDVSMTALVEMCLVKLARDVSAAPDLKALAEMYQTQYAGSETHLVQIYLSETGTEAINTIGLYLESRSLGSGEKGRASAGNLRVRRTGGFNYKMVVYVAIMYCSGLIPDGTP